MSGVGPVTLPIFWLATVVASAPLSRMRYTYEPAATTRLPRESPLPGDVSASETDENTVPLSLADCQISEQGPTGCPLTVVCRVDIAYTCTSLVTYTRSLNFTEMVGELLMSPSLGM